MKVPAFLKQIQFRLVTDIEFVTPIADIDSRCVYLITVSQMYPVDVATDLYCYGS